MGVSLGAEAPDAKALCSVHATCGHTFGVPAVKGYRVVSFERDWLPAGREAVLRAHGALHVANRPTEHLMHWSGPTDQGQRQ
jgi:hypothetical protein